MPWQACLGSPEGSARAANVWPALQLLLDLSAQNVYGHFHAAQQPRQQPLRLLQEGKQQVLPDYNIRAAFPPGRFF